MTNETDIYGKLGRDWWERNGADIGATPQQIKFSAARHNGATRAKAAELASYKGTKLAEAAEAGIGDITVTPAEIKRKLSRIIRGPDGTLALKASELLLKIEQTEKDRGETPEDDGFGDWRLERDWIKLPNGGCSYLMFRGGLSNLRLLHDTHHIVMKEPFGPELWSRFYTLLNDGARAELDRELADSSFQHEARLKIWAEIGTKPPGPVDHRHLVRGPSADV